MTETIESESYEHWLYHNVCPWCNELFEDVDHACGCPNPQYPLTDKAKKLEAFIKLFFDE